MFHQATIAYNPEARRSDLFSFLDLFGFVRWSKQVAAYLVGEVRMVFGFGGGISEYYSCGWGWFEHVCVCPLVAVGVFNGGVQNHTVQECCFKVQRILIFFSYSTVLAGEL